MRQTALFALCALLLGVGASRAQAPAGDLVVRLNPALAQIVPAGARLEVLKDDFFGLVGKPVWVKEGQSGYLLIGDPGANTIYKWTPDGKLSVFLERSGFTGKDGSRVGALVGNGRLTVVASGAWGLAQDKDGRIVIAAGGDRTVTRLEKDGTRTVLADRVDGKRFSTPIELVYRSDGALYISDGTAGLRDRAQEPSAEFRYQALSLLKDGKVRLLDTNAEVGTGIALSPDEKVLYNGGRGLKRYDVQPDGTLTNARVFVDWGPDQADLPRLGVTTDLLGNVYCTGPGGVWIIAPDGTRLGSIRVPDNVANLAFGDPDGKSLFVGTRRSLYRIRLNVAGLR